MNILNSIIQKYCKLNNPIKYWRNKGVAIGDNSEIYPTVNFGTEPWLISIGERVRIGSNVQFYTHDGGVHVLRIYEKYKDIDLFGKIVVGNNVNICPNVMILPGVTIGSNVVIACGAIVTRDVPDNCIVAGVPARVVETLEKFVEKNEARFLHTKFMSVEEKRKATEEYFSKVDGRTD